MDIVTYALCKKIASGALSGIANMSVEGQDLIISTTNGQTLTIHFPSPTDLNLIDSRIDENYHLFLTFSNGQEVDCGVISQPEASIVWSDIED